MTNATMITPMAADFIASLHPRNVQISVYSLKDEIHDRITTVKGSLQRTLQGIKALSSRGVTISIATPILDVNVNHVLGMNQWAMENGYDIRFSYKMSPSSNKNKMPETHSVILQNKNNTLPSIFRMTEFNTKLKNIMTKPARIHGDGRHLCQGGFRNLSIDYLGNVHPCNTIRYSFGNIIENDFESIWNSDAAKKWRAITIDDYPICANCKARKYCEPCPADYFAKTGSISHIDEQSCIYGKAIYDYIKENNL